MYSGKDNMALPIEVSKLMTGEVVDDQSETSSETHEYEATVTLLSAQSKFLQISLDTLLRVLLFVGENHWPEVALVCKFLRTLFVEDTAWKALAQESFPTPALVPINPLRSERLRISTHTPYKALLSRKPRVKFSGVYIHEYKYIRKVGPRTLWSPEDHKGYLEISHFRYVLFKENGTLFYASTPLAPDIMLPAFLFKVKRKFRPIEFTVKEERLQDRIFTGDYRVRKGELKFEADLGEYGVGFSFDYKKLKFDWGRQERMDWVMKSHHTVFYNSIGSKKQERIHHSVDQLYDFELSWKYSPLF
eukprot:maker-scaffold_7-snap-gene-3.57-mRNA-1 protein AED:0.01 eAED:0.01 QI:0/1/0.5/1/1/1/2/47/303